MTSFLGLLAAIAIYLVPIAIALFLIYWVVRKAIRDELGTRVDALPSWHGSEHGTTPRGQ